MIGEIAEIAVAVASGLMLTLMGIEVIRAHVSGNPRPPAIMWCAVLIVLALFSVSIIVAGVN